MRSAGPLGALLAIAPCLLFVDSAHAQTSLAIDDAIGRAQRRDERVQIAAQRLVQAEASLREARAFFLPELTATASGLHRDQSVTRDVGGSPVTIQAQDALSGVATLRVHVFDARAFPAVAAGRHGRRAAALDAAEVQRVVGFETADAFLLVLNLAQVTRAAERRRDLARTILDDARARLGAALVGANDVTKAELELATAERELVGARAHERSARLGLQFLVGADAPTELSDPGLLLRASTSTAPPERLDVAAARARAAVARQQAAEPVLGALPRVDLTGNVRATNEAGLSGRDVTAWLGLDLSWEIFDGGERYAVRDAARAEARIAALQARAARRGARLQADRARVALEAADAAIGQAVQAAQAAERNARETAILYREGLASALDVADASARWYDAEVSAVRERYGRAQAVLSLRDALGLDPLGRQVRP